MADAAPMDDDTTATSGEVDPQDVADAQSDNAQTSTTGRGRATAERLLTEGENMASGKDPAQASLIAQYGLNAQQARAILQRARDTLAQNAPQMINLAAAQHMSNPGGWGQIYAGSMGAAANAQQDINKQLAGYDLSMVQAGQGGLDAQLKMLTNRLAFYDKVAPAAMRVEGLPPVPAAKQPNDPVHTILAGMGVTDFQNDPRVKPAYEAYLAHMTRNPEDAGQKPPQGYTWGSDPDTKEPILVPIKGGPKDPNAPAAAGSRESVFNDRVINAGVLGAQALTNIARLPTGASTGIFGTGVGATPGHGIFESSRDALRNTLAPQEVQDYNLMIAGLSRNLANIESAGLGVTQNFVDSLGSIQLRAGDTEVTKLEKLAEARQVIEKGLLTKLVNPRISQQQKDLMHQITEQVQTAVPYTMADVQDLKDKWSKGDNISLGQLMQQKGLAPKGGNSSPAATTQTKYQEGQTATGPSGKMIYHAATGWTPLAPPNAPTAGAASGG
jgi:hypothetical protein